MSTKHEWHCTNVFYTTFTPRDVFEPRSHSALEQHGSSHTKMSSEVNGWRLA